jgi:hypothetical protein
MQWINDQRTHISWRCLEDLIIKVCFTQGSEYQGIFYSYWDLLYDNGYILNISYLRLQPSFILLRASPILLFC